MTRDEKIAKARELRGEGLSYAAIARRLGVPDGSTVLKWLNPDRAREYRRRSESRPERKAAKRQWERAHRATCPNCGAACGVGTTSPSQAVARCANCYRAELIEGLHERARAFEEVWATGATLREMAEHFGTTVQSIGKSMSEYRDRGYDIPYRQTGPRQPGKHDRLRRERAAA